ncbi:MAG: ABC transporter ATP-binding protein [Acidaminococcus sp.]|uniref:ABC transporter ATP-binding protein n=1 Tax=Acidaminococcus intestini TaxID=187327 RepID=A0A943EEV6_9FIRM|nr:ABC transporter ATP-binding protein [Acidaminococcus sp.]MBS5520391.1 ABC transporter ATP-binding protein [Acidaminococcus intestini]MDY2738231.1 ABC transporter ATP-binding protein [Acidaminococcus sp.]
MNLYLRILKFIRPYLGRLIAAGFCTVMTAAANLYVPWIVRDVIDKVFQNKDSDLLNLISLGIVVIFFARGIFYYGQSYLMNYVGESIVIDVRGIVYRKLMTLSTHFFDTNKLGTIMSYVTNDVAALQGAMVANSIEIITETSVLIGSVGAMVYLDWKLTLFTFCTFPVVLFFMDFFGKKIRKSGHRIQQATADITSILQETLAATRVVKSFVREPYEIARFDQQNKANFYANMKSAKLMGTLSPVIEFIAALGVTAIIWFGGRSVIDGDITAGSLVAFLVYAINISNPIKRIARVMGSIQKALAAAERVFYIMDLTDTIPQKPDAITLPSVEGNVEFRHVSFAYNKGETILHDVSFSAKPGQAIALVGPSGAGKSTVASLLPRFYDVTEGAILVDGHDVRDVTLASLREQVGIVPQETNLFNDTVYNNILYGRLDATRDEVIAAAKAANADEFIQQLPQGYDTQLGDRGVNISGGQRQRISIARAILKNPRILILDEATSALDTESERIVQEALDRLMVGRTSFVIAHRLSTIQNAAKIIVLDKGSIVEEGTHQQLMAKHGLYAHLHDIQFKENQTASGTFGDDASEDA